MAAAFLSYVAWAIMGWEWLVPPIVIFVGYAWLSPPTAENSRRMHGVPAVLSIWSAAVAWLALASATRPAHVAVSLFDRLCGSPRDVRRLTARAPVSRATAPVAVLARRLHELAAHHGAVPRCRRRDSSESGGRRRGAWRDRAGCRCLRAHAADDSGYTAGRATMGLCRPAPPPSRRSPRGRRSPRRPGRFRNLKWLSNSWNWGHTIPIPRFRAIAACPWCRRPIGSCMHRTCTCSRPAAARSWLAARAGGATRRLSTRQRSA